MIAPRELWVDETVAAGLGITPRLCDLLCGAACGMGNAEIGRLHFITENTVKTQMRRLFAKLEAKDRAEAVALAYEHGILRTPAVRLAVQAARGGWVAVRREVAS